MMIYFPQMRNVIIILVLMFVAAASTAAQCPSIKVFGPAGITPLGDNAIFRAEVDVVGSKQEYLWKVDKGTITEGQGTPNIVVATYRDLAGQTITATVQIKGLLSGCENTGSEIAGIEQPSPCHWGSDSWERLKPNDERGRLDVFFAELSNSPTQVGLVVLQITRQEKLNSNNARIQFILKHAKFRKFDKQRLWFALELSDEPRTSITRLFPGSELPCEECLLIKGEHL